MVIIRVGMSAKSRGTDHAASTLEFSSQHHTRSHSNNTGPRVVTVSDLEGQALPMSRLQVHITKMRETDRATFEAEAENDTSSETDRKLSGFEGRGRKGI